MVLSIAMTCFNIKGQGTYQRAYRLAVELSKMGHSVTLLAASPTGKMETEKMQDNLELVSFPGLFKKYFLSGWDFHETMQRIRWSKDRHFDIVHSFEMRPTCLYPALTMQKRGSILCSDWADWFGKGGSVEERPKSLVRNILRPLETYYEENFRKNANGTTVICSALFSKAIDLGLEKESILYLSNGFNNTDLVPMDTMVARNRLDLPEDDFLIGYVGSGFPKDMELMQESFSLLKPLIPNLKLVHVGRTNYSVSVQSQVIATGPVSTDKLNCYLSACNVFWLPLKNMNANIGRFPIKLSDYLTIGRPIVSTRVGDLPAFFDKYKIGLLATDDPADLAEKVFTLYMDKKLAYELGQNALALVKSETENWRARAIELEQFYYKIIGNFGIEKKY